MKRFGAILANLLREEAGQDLIEYALVAGLIGLAAIVALGPVGNSISTIFNNLNTSLSSAA